MSLSFYLQQIQIPSWWGSCDYQRSFVANSIRKTRNEERKREIIGLLRSRGDLSCYELSEELGYSFQTVKGLTGRLADAGKITRYIKNGRTWYHIAEAE